MTTQPNYIHRLQKGRYRHLSKLMPCEWPHLTAAMIMTTTMTPNGRLVDETKTAASSSGRDRLQKRGWWVHRCRPQRRRKRYWACWSVGSLLLGQRRLGESSAVQRVGSKCMQHVAKDTFCWVAGLPYPIPPHSATRLSAWAVVIYLQNEERRQQSFLYHTFTAGRPAARGRTVAAKVGRRASEVYQSCYTVRPGVQRPRPAVVRAAWVAWPATTGVWLSAYITWSTDHQTVSLCSHCTSMNEVDFTF